MYLYECINGFILVVGTFFKRYVISTKCVCMCLCNMAATLCCTAGHSCFAVWLFGSPT